jgi:hypothetical protein
MPQANWTAIEDALIAWVKGATGLPDGSVIWDDQRGERPAAPFATLHLDGDVTPGVFDEASHRVNPDAPPTSPGVPGEGDELIFETVAQGEFTCTVHVFAAATNGASSARVLTNRVRNALSIEPQVEAFDVLGIAIIDRGTVRNLTALLDTEFESRASVDVRFRVADGTTATGTFIEAVETENDIEST